MDDGISSAKTNMLTDTLTVELLRVAMRENEFDCQEDLYQNSGFDCSGLSGLRSNELKTFISNQELFNE